MEAAYTSTDRWMDKDVVQIYDGIVFRNKKEWNNAICSKMDGLRDYHIKSDRQRKTYAITYICNPKKKNDTHQLIYKMEINSQTWIMNLQSWGGEKWGWRTVWEFGIDTCQGLTLDTMQAVSNSLQPPWTVDARLLCPSPSLRVCPGSCPLNQWCHPAIASSLTLSSFCLQSFPSSGSFSNEPVVHIGGQSIRASASASVLPWVFRIDFL